MCFAKIKGLKRANMSASGEPKPAIPSFTTWHGVTVVGEVIKPLQGFT